MSENLTIGSIVDGKVVKIKPFGAIVSLNNRSQGLVHISQISDSFVQNIEDYLAVGDEVKVKVLSVNEASNKISLSIKDALAPSAAKAAPANTRKFDHTEAPSSSKGPAGDLEDKIKDWLKQSNERQAGINKRNNRR